MKSNGRVTSISMAVKGETDIRQEDSMREPPNKLHTSSNTENNLCAHLSFYYSFRNAKLFVRVSLLTSLVEGSYKTKAAWIPFQLQYPDIW